MAWLDTRGAIKVNAQNFNKWTELKKELEFKKSDNFLNYLFELYEKEKANQIKK